MSSGRRNDQGADRPTRRLFIAVPLSEEARSVVADLVAGVRTRVAGADSLRWVRLDGLHLTLRFLGRVVEDGIPPIASAIDKVAAVHRPFSLTISGGGAFPSPSRPRVLWLAVGEGANDLAAVERALVGPLATLGWQPEERPYAPHLTLARSDGVRDGPAAARDLVTAALSLSVAFTVDRIVLYESVPGGHGPARYVAIHEASLRAE
jgi:2'-5' RNA ligase